MLKSCCGKTEAEEEGREEKRKRRKRRVDAVSSPRARKPNTSEAKEDGRKERTFRISSGVFPLIMLATVLHPTSLEKARREGELRSVSENAKSSRTRVEEEDEEPRLTAKA